MERVTGDVVKADRALEGKLETSASLIGRAPATRGRRPAADALLPPDEDRRHGAGQLEHIVPSQGAARGRTKAPMMIPNFAPPWSRTLMGYADAVAISWSLDMSPLDAEGNTYTTGSTTATNLSTSSALPCPGWDSAFVVKLSDGAEPSVVGA